VLAEFGSAVEAVPFHARRRSRAATPS
jgi:hypothetical protein